MDSSPSLSFSDKHTAPWRCISFLPRAQPTISKQKLILFVHSPAKRQANTLQTSTCGLIICFCALLQYEGAKKGENEEIDLTSLKKAFCFANVQQQRAFISICALLIKNFPMQIKEPVVQLSVQSLLFRATFNGLDLLCVNELFF